MENNKKLRKFRLTTVLIAIPLFVLECGSIALWYFRGIWWPCIAIYVLFAIPFGIIFSKYYYEKIEYICPECHEQFKPKFREMFFASHTPKTRKLVCPKCGKKSYCVEVWGDKK